MLPKDVLVYKEVAIISHFFQLMPKIALLAVCCWQ